LEFLSQYSASVYVDLFHSLSLEEHTKDINVKSTRTVPKVGLMMVRHIQPARFEVHTVWRAHVVECYGHEKGRGGRRK
jgi:hypothetical protein